MFKEIPYKKKFIYAAVLFLLLFFALYKKNFSEIIVLKEEVGKLEKLETTYSDEPSRIALLQQEVNILDRSIGGTKTNPGKIQKALLEFVSDQKFAIDVVAVKEIHRSQKGGFVIYTNQLTAEGKYQNLIKLLYGLEKDFNQSKLVNIKFFTEKDYSNNNKTLYLTLIFQNYEHQK